ncbi:MAG: hypothetical protein LBD72_00030 [Puniceicoccales bacterium]|jgi:hypothetical protein|nr:hypothetical protein [Puniceicoccales bacterium]
MLIACFSNTTVGIEEVLPLAAPVWARVQVCYPQQLLAKTLDHARNIYPHPSLHILPIVLLGAWGYPDFNGFLPEDPITVTFLRGTSGDNKLNWVACAKLAALGSINSTLEIQGLKTRKIGEWTIVGRDEEILSLAEAGRDVFFPVVPQSFRCPTIRIQLADELIKLFIGGLERMVLQNIARATTLEGSMPAISILNLALNLVKQIDAAEFRFGCLDENLEIQFSLHAADGSDLAMLFDAPSETVELAWLEAFLPCEGRVRWFCKNNPATTKLIAHHFLDALFVYDGNRSIADTSDGDIYNFFDSVWNLCDGLTVVQANFTSDGKPSLCKLWATSLTQDQLEVWVDFVYNKIIPLVVGETAKMLWGGEINLVTKAAPKAFSHKKHTISRASIKLDLMEGGITKYQYVDSYYYCAFGDFVAMTNSKKSMRYLIDEITSGNLPHVSKNGSANENGIVFSLQANCEPQTQKWIFHSFNFSLKFEKGAAIFRLTANGGDCKTQASKCPASSAYSAHLSVSE